MTATKRILSFLLVIFCALSCVQDIIIDEQAEDLVQKTFSISSDAELPSSKASLDQNLKPVWEIGDSISVFDPVQNVSRIFTVGKVENGKATISGQISPGDFPFSAVFPARAVQSWVSIDSCLMAFPQVQSVPDGGKVDGHALVSRAYCENPDEEPIIFRNQTALLQFRVEQDGITAVSFTLRGSDCDRSYRVSHSGSAFASGEYYYVPAAPGSFPKGISAVCENAWGDRYTKTSGNKLNLKRNSVSALKTVSGGVHSIFYDIFDTGSIGKLDDFLSSTGLFSGLDESTQTLINLAKPIAFLWQNQEVVSFSFTHKSMGTDSQPVTLSGIVYVPKNALNGGTKINGMVIANHGSIACDRERPTLSTDMEAVTAWKGYAVVLSDYHGFGADIIHPQAYLNPDIAGRGNSDAILAARQLLQDKGVTIGNKFYNIGYSQGGFNGMANVKYVSQHPELGIKFTKTFVGGGPFDIVQTWKDYMAGMCPKATSFVPITVTSFNECEHLGIPYDKMFIEPLLSNYQDWILSKNYTRGQINSKIGTRDVTKMVTADMMDSNSEVNQAFIRISNKYSLVKDWRPADGNKIYIYHSTQDEIVPYSNFTSIKNYFNSLNDLDCDITYWDGDDGGHMDAVGQWALKILLNW